jgi:hypothetical protein
MNIPVAVVAAVMICGAGCQPTSRVAPVSGRVTLDGKPLAGVHVSFEPIAPEGKLDAGGGSYAIADADGKYKLLMVDGGRTGAVVGKHRVQFTARSQVPDDVDLPVRPPPSVMVPDKFNRNSTLTFDVPADGTSAANFELESK